MGAEALGPGQWRAVALSGTYDSSPRRGVFAGWPQRLAGARDGTLKLWDGRRETLAQLRETYGRSQDSSFSPTVELCCRKRRQDAEVVGRRSGNWCATSRHTMVRSVVFSADGRALLSVIADGTIRLWDAMAIRDGSKDPLSDNLLRDTNCIALAPDGRFVAGGDPASWSPCRNNEFVQPYDFMRINQRGTIPEILISPSFVPTP